MRRVAGTAYAPLEEEDLGGAPAVLPVESVSLDTLVHQSLQVAGAGAGPEKSRDRGPPPAPPGTTAATAARGGGDQSEGAPSVHEGSNTVDGTDGRGGPPRPWRQRAWAYAKKHGVLIGTVIGALLGLLVGAMVGQASPSHTVVLLLKLPGALFMRMLKLLVVPLLTASVITGVSTLRSAGGGRVAAWVFALYLATTVAAAVLGVVMVLLLQPGVGMGGDAGEAGPAPIRNTTATEAVVSLVYALVPDNIVASAATMDMLGLITFSLAFGAAALAVGAPGERMLAWVGDFSMVIMQLVQWVMYLTPIGVCSLLAGRLAESGASFWSFVAALALYMATVFTGLVVHGLVLLPLLYLVLARANPYRYLARVGQALLTAFATSSSSATLPITIRECIAAGVPEPLAKFGISCGCTVNMNGTAHLCVCLCICLCVCVCLCWSRSMRVSASAFVCLCASLCVGLYLRVSLHVGVGVAVGVCLWLTRSGGHRHGAVRGGGGPVHCQLLWHPTDRRPDGRGCAHGYTRCGWRGGYPRGRHRDDDPGAPRRGPARRGRRYPPAGGLAPGPLPHRGERVGRRGGGRRGGRPRAPPRAPPRRSPRRGQRAQLRRPPH
jgi:Na+/H+-dicarboxylate symporter